MRRVVVALVLLPFLLGTCATSAIGHRAEAQVNATYSDSDPAWSPDGRYIAFTRWNWKGKPFQSVYIVTVKTGDQRRLVTGAAPSWSPDGTRIAFARVSGGISTIRIDGTDLTRLTTRDDSYPVWSPDGRNIAFQRNEPAANRIYMGLYVIPASGGSARRVGTAPRTDSQWVDWSPDGTKIAFSVSRRDPESWQIQVARRDGTGVRGLVTGSAPDWSPDGRQITFEDEKRTHVMRSDGGQVRMLRKGQWPKFSPDGKRIAFYRGGALWIMDAKGSHLGRLTRPKFGYDEDHSWSPDGRMLAFSRVPCCGGLEEGRVWVVRSDGSESRQLSR
jgi:Tol biopolymer transport system component